MKNKYLVGILVFLPFIGLFAITNKNKYVEYIYSDIENKAGETTVTATLHGSFVRRKDAVITQSPYYLKLAVFDVGSEYYCVKLNSLILNSVHQKELLNLEGFNECVEFKSSQLQEGNFVAIVTEDLVLLKDDYELKATLTICKNEKQCETKIINGIFELEISEYESNAFLDALLSV